MQFPRFPRSAPALFAALAFAAGLPAAQAQVLAYDIPPQALDASLAQIARQGGVQLLLPPALAQGRQAPAVRGRMQVGEALARALAGSGLQAQREGSAVVIRPAPTNGVDGTLAEVRVTAQAERDATTEGSGSYAARGATLMKGAQSLKDIPQSVTVVTRQRMDDQRLDTVTDVLANTTGVTLVKRPNGGSDIYSRGFMTETLQYDGVPLLRYNSFGNDLTASAIHLDRIEVLRGAQGLLEGAGSPAGSVNLVRKRGLAERALTVEGRAGSWDTYGTRIDVGGPLNEAGTLRGRAVADYEDRKSFLDTVWDRNSNVYAALDLDVNPHTTVGLGAVHARLKGNSMTYDGVPRYTDGTAVPLPRSAYIGAGWNEVSRRETQVFLDLEHRFNADWKLKAGAVHVREDFDAIRSHANGMVAAGSSTVDGTGFSYDNSAQGTAVDVNLSGKLRALGLAHEVVLGANYSKQRRDDHYVQYWMHTSYDVFFPNHRTPGLSAHTPTGIWDQKYDIEQKGVYALLRSRLTDRATLVMGARASWYDYAGKGTSGLDDYTSASAQKESGEITPYGGLVYALTPRWSAYASYAEIFDPQGATDVNRNLLPPMTGVNYELGVKGELFDGALDTSLAVYRIDQKNRAVTDYDSPQVCDGWYCSRAAGKVRSEGFEVELHGEPARGWQVSAGYTYGRNKVLEDSDADLIGTPFDYQQPRHMLRVWSNYRLPGSFGKWQLGAGLNYRSEQRTSSTAQLNPVQGGYTVWNARVAYEINRNWTAALNVNNVFDKQYYAFISSNYYYSHVGEPRKFLLTLRGTF